MQIRILTRDDAAAYRELRLASLRDHPQAFPTDVSEEEGLPIEEFQRRAGPHESTVTFGALEGDDLVGIATLQHPTRKRQQFRAIIVGMYVTTYHRRQGVARALVAAAVEHARTLSDVEEVSLCVTSGNAAARKLYISCGFEPEYVEPRFFKYEGEYIDLERLRMPLRRSENE